MSRLISPRVLSQCVRSENHPLKVHLDICMVTREVKVPITHQIWLIYGRTMRGIIKLGNFKCILATVLSVYGDRCVVTHICSLLNCMFFISLLHSGEFSINVTQSSAQTSTNINYRSVSLPLHRYPLISSIHPLGTMYFEGSVNLVP